MSQLLKIRASETRRVRWKNDGGWTTEIARDPADGDDFRWRVSIAEIERDGPFSPYPGVERDLLLLSGAGIELDIDDAPPIRLDERFQRAHFSGEDRVACRLLAGPTRDFNVMTQRDAVHAEVMARPLVGSMVLLPERGVIWLAHLLGGSAEARAGDPGVSLDAGDTLRVEFGEGTGRVAIDGGGEIVLVKLAPASS